MKVSFFTRGNKLQVRVPYNGGYLRLTTGIEIPENVKFISTKQSFHGKGDEAKQMNSELDRHRLFIREVVAGGYDLKREYDGFIKPTTFVDDVESFELVHLCNKYISDATNGLVKKRDGSRLKPSTIQAFRFTTSVIRDYTKTCGTIVVDEFNLGNIQSIQTKRTLADRWAKYFNGLVEYMRVREFKISSRWSVMLNIRIMMHHFEKEYYFVLPEVPKVNNVENPIVVLEPEFVFKFMDGNVYEKLEGAMRYTWEVSATILVTSMRISDVLTLNWHHLNERKDGLFLSKENEKTGGETNMILPRKLALIFKNNMAKFGSIFTPVDGDKRGVIYNNISKVFRKYDELHVDISASMPDVDGKGKNVTQKLYDWVTPHMLRKSAITSMLVNGISEEHVKFASGHSASSKAFERYRAFIDRNFNNQLNDYYSKMN
jgi:integrase